MTAPNYTEDLTDLNLGEAATSWVELSGSITINGTSEAYNAQGLPAGADPDYSFIQGNFAVTQDCTKDASVGSLAYNNGTGTGGHGTDGAYLVWQNYMVSSNIDAYANGGFQLAVGSALNQFKVWFVGGVDKSPYPYGGWVNHAVNTSVTPDGTTATAPTATEQYIGAAVYVVTGSSKGEVHNVDAIRYGRCSAIFEFGDEPNGYCTFGGFAAQNDLPANRWGLISSTSGGYLWKGRMSIGTATNLADFREVGKTVFIQWTPKVTPNFNLIEVINTGTNLSWDNVLIICQDTTTASRGRFLMTDNATVEIKSCTFTDMDTFVFQSNATISSSIFLRSNSITTGGATFTNCTFQNFTNTSTYISTTASSVANIINCIFVRDSGSANAVDIGTISTNTDIDWDSNTLQGTTSSGWIGVAGNSISSTTGGAIKVTFGSNVVLNISVVNNATIPTVEISGTGTVNVLSNVSNTITVVDSANNAISGAQVAVYLITDDTELYNNQTDINGEVTFTSSANVPIYIRVRKSTAGSTRYRPIETTGNTGANGTLLTVTLIEDTFVELTL